MKNVFIIAGVALSLYSLGNILILGADFHGNTLSIGIYTFLALLGFGIALKAESMKLKEVDDKDIEDYIRSVQRSQLRNQMVQWDKELTEEEIEKLSRGRY